MPTVDSSRKCMRCACDLTAEINERSDVQVLTNDVNIKVPPRHQPKDVAPNHVHFTVPVQNRQQAGSQNVVGLGSNLLAVRRHALRSIRAVCLATRAE